MSWTLDDAGTTYGIDKWGNDYFSINDAGEVTVRLKDGVGMKDVSLQTIVEGLKERGSAMPHILRFRDLLDDRVVQLNSAFNDAIAASGYKGNYRGVYPIKVNQQQQVVEEITTFGKKYHYGLEAGSKPELIAALAYMHDPSALIICNGYKDDEFIDLALMATQMGLNVILVLEMPSELPAIITRSKALGIRPALGIRFRLSTPSEGHWAESGGDRSVFGLNTPQVIDVVDLLKAEGYLDTLKLFHYHQGSQLPNIHAIRMAATEAVRVYVNLIQEGAPMGILDMGGGLAVDYDGSHSNSSASCNYSLEEYATNLVEVIQEHCDKAEVTHPTIVTESGRAVVAYYSVLVFNILDTTEFCRSEPLTAPDESSPEVLHSLWEIRTRLQPENLQECLNDAVFYRDQVRELFRYGMISLRQRAMAEDMYWHICTRIGEQVETLENVTEDIQHVQKNLIDFYYANLSVFQSLPDAWAINQLFPVMPIHRLTEQPERRAVIADITCDCDGKIDQFISPEGIQKFLPVHQKRDGEDYNFAAFLVGAYQETLGDLHNLLGDPNVVTIALEDGEITYSHEVEGDSVADVLSYVEYAPKDLETRFRSFAEKAVRKGTITAAQRKEIMTAYREGLQGYTYYVSK